MVAEFQSDFETIRRDVHFLGIFMIVTGIKAEKKKSKKSLEEQSEDLDDF